MQPEADLAELDLIESYIVHGVSLPLLETPPAVWYKNTPIVHANAGLVRARIEEYVDFGAVRLLPPEYVCPYGVQPIHAIIKEGKKLRIVLDLARNLNTYLRYQYFKYSGIDEAVESASQDCFFGKIDLANCFLSFPLHVDVQSHFIFSFATSFISSFVCLLDCLLLLLFVLSSYRRRFRSQETSH